MIQYEKNKINQILLIIKHFIIKIKTRFIGAINTIAHIIIQLRLGEFSGSIFTPYYIGSLVILVICEKQQRAFLQLKYKQSQNCKDINKIKNDNNKCCVELRGEVPSGEIPRNGSLGLEEDENGAHNTRSRAMSSFMFWQRKKEN